MTCIKCFIFMFTWITLVYTILLNLHSVQKSVTFYKNYIESESCSWRGLVYSIQHYVIKFVSDLRQVGVFLQVLQFPPLIKLTATIFTEILLKVVLNTIILTQVKCLFSVWRIVAILGLRYWCPINFQSSLPF
jgi:hypothetical protein